MKQEVTVIPFTYHCHHRNDRKYKYLGGVLGPDDCIYCIPSDADFVLKVDPATQTAYEVGESLEGRTGRLNCNKWQNGFLAADGRIYGIPLKSASVLCIDVATQTVYTVGSGFTGANKWEGGVLAHDGAADPLLSYANRAALTLWRRRWSEMVDLPSRLTAEPAERRARSAVLARALRSEAIEGYGGIRIDSTGRRFAIEAACLWSLRDGTGRPCGQAARFSRWWLL